MSSPTTIDWPTFLAQHDLHGNTLPQGWREAPHFGNALVGSMLYMAEDELRLEVFRADVCDHRDDSYGWTAYSRPHFRIGHFVLRTVGTHTGFTWRKDLWNAELTGTITTSRGEIAIRHFVHAEDMAIVSALTPSEGEAKFGWTWHPAEAATTRPGYPSTPEETEIFANRYGNHYRETLKPPVANPEGRQETSGKLSIWIQDLHAGGQYATAWSERAEQGTRTHIVTIANSYPGSTAADTAVDDLAKVLSLLEPLSRTLSQTLSAEPDTAPGPSWIDAHRAWWHAYYPRSYVSIPDKELESLYWQTIYRYGSCARAGRYYMDTAGLWFQGAQWPYTTHDWNTQSAHWAVYAANRLEQGANVVERLHAAQDTLVENVYPEAWRDDSAFLALATAADLRGTRIADRRYYDCVGCLPWLLHNAWWQYRFSMDEAMLRDTIFPLLRRSVNLYLHLLHEDDDGRLHLAPTYSPETSVCADANFDLALFKWGCHILLAASARLGIDDPLIPRWRDCIERLVDYPEDDKGFRLGRDTTAWDDHRHLSHLLMIYPLYLVNVEQPDRADVLERSYALAHGGAGSDDGAIEELMAMVQAHAGPIGTAIGDGDRALVGLRQMVSEFTPVGLWPCGNNPCIESTLTLANTIQDMLIQSWSDPALDEAGPIRIFPALPSEWNDVEFHDLRAEGAFLVSAKRSAGQTQWVRIKSLAGEPCRVRPGMAGALRVEGAREHAIEEVAPGIFDIDLKQDEAIELRPSCPST